MDVHPRDGVKSKNLEIAQKPVVDIMIKKATVRVGSRIPFSILYDAEPWLADCVGVSSSTPEGGRFDSLSGHTPRLHVPSLGCEEATDWFLSHMDVSPFHSP